VRRDGADVDVRTHRAGREVEIQPAAGRDVTDALERGRLDDGRISAKNRQAHEKMRLAHIGCSLHRLPLLRAHNGSVFARFLFSGAPRRVERFPGAKRAPRRLENNDHGRLRAVAVQDSHTEHVGIMSGQ
jgi:hypothetical protein